VLVLVQDGDVGSLVRERQSDRSPDATVSAGDERHLALEPSPSRVRPLGARLWLHPRLQTGLAPLALRASELLLGLRLLRHVRM
jgi:hypothetical protein